MAQSGEQSIPRRRSRGNTDEAGMTLQQPMTGRVSPPRTDAYGNTGYQSDADIYDDEPPQRSSTLRRNTTDAPPYRSSKISPQTTSGINTSRRISGSRDFPMHQPRFPMPPTTPPLPQEPTKTKHKSSLHWLMPVGIGMVAMLLLWILGSSALAWGTQMYNNVRYGYPRTFQTDAVVGHSDSKAHPSHFIAMNLNRQVIVVEFMGGDPAKTKTYVAPVYIAGQNGDLAPVTLEFRDVTGDGKVDMIIHIHMPNQDQYSVFINDGTEFRPSNSNDKIHM